MPSTSTPTSEPLPRWLTASACELARLIRSGAVTSDDILDGSITFNDLGANGCSANQLIERTPTGWACAEIVYSVARSS